ncbi:hypothetical protein AAL_07012 [Moelleriella libera RCEF 2490]|uniref:Nascent polypeptide-associated complex subunit alpha-like UBA domain-containing protein n=1 Tax=Moelleriella libera RCEF 2490 TaxID=1081109 RepID=A0A167Y2J4_9HYPO|nr:hypothetical protein AAL_07012 [Moelleriella libera RCEF 2490]
MTEEQPPHVHKGATVGDGDDDSPTVTKYAEDRKAASALASLDVADHDEASSREVDSEAVNKAMKSLGDSKSSTFAKANPTKNVKVDDKDVNLLIEELDLTKLRATELLKAHDGDVVRAMRAWVQA